MELHHEFTVPVPVEEVWRALLDIERIAPCMPGATVEEFDGTTVTGRVKVKVGPIAVTYRGTAVFEERDADARRMVLTAGGKETRGQGTARATVRGSLVPEDGGGTRVFVGTELTVTGRPAQFGRGVLGEVGDRLVGQFADRLARQLTAEDATLQAEPTAEPATRPGRPTVAAATATRTATATTGAPAESEALDLLQTAALPLAKRAVVPALAMAAVAAVVAVVLRRNRR